MAAKVLAIEDEPTHAQLLLAILTRAGYETVTETDSRNAVDRARKERPDVILLDINMPAPSGYEIFEQLRADKSTLAIPIIMVTARTQRTEVELGLKMGANDYVTKPFDADDLLSSIGRVLQR